MRIKIEKQDETPLYMQIARQIEDQIRTGSLRAGYRLPPERKLAESLRVNRTTVLNAYRELKAKGLVCSHVGQGTVVADISSEDPAVKGQVPVAPTAEPVWNHFFNKASERFAHHDMNELLSLASRQDVISFATGIAAPECGNGEVLELMKAELTGRTADTSLIHSPVEGFLSLRKALSKQMLKRGCYCSAEEVMVVAGSQQGIDLAGRVLIDEGDIIFVEEPSFFPALRVFKGMGARIIGIPMEGDGMDMDSLAQLLKRCHPKFIYTMPSFHNPTGREMSLEKRRRLLELAYQYRVLILEDDAYGELSYDKSSLPTLKSLDSAGYVIYLSTFSKIIYPGLRIGWVVAKKPLIKRFSAVRQVSDLHTGCLSQQIVEKFITGPGYETHLNKICSEYRNRRNAMAAALKQYAPPGMEFDYPAGGYYIWCTLPDGLDARQVLKRAGAYGVAFIPGRTFSAEKRCDNKMRLNFTFAKTTDIETGIIRLCRAVTDLLQEYKEYRTEDELMEITPIV